jgi:hypothetical protein
MVAGAGPFHLALHAACKCVVLATSGAQQDHAIGFESTETRLLRSVRHVAERLPRKQAIRVFSIGTGPVPDSTVNPLKGELGSCGRCRSASR